MNFELNLIENSYDYIKETLYYYKKIGYGESHDEDRNSIEEKESGKQHLYYWFKQLNYY